jgi:TIR domain
MATLREFFDTDFTHVLNVSRPLKIQFEKSPDLEIQARLHLDFAGNAKYISCFLPAHPHPIAALVAILEQINLILESTKQVEVHAGYVGERPISNSELVFTGRVYFYSETDIPNNDFEDVRRQAQTNGLAICSRTQSYAMERSRLEKPLAFICHDSRDKVQVARPIAMGLSKLMCPVWYDEFSLKVGDRLRESIEKGLKECKKCVLVLSPQFFGNTGWTRVEFNSIFTRELIKREDFLLPVWCGVTKEQVFEYSPSLADRVAVDWSLGEEEVVRQLIRVIR